MLIHLEIRRIAEDDIHLTPLDMLRQMLEVIGDHGHLLVQAIEGNRACSHIRQTFLYFDTNDLGLCTSTRKKSHGPISSAEIYDQAPLGQFWKAREQDAIHGITKDFPILYNFHIT